MSVVAVPFLYVFQRQNELLNVRHRFPPSIRQRRRRILRDSGPNDDTTVPVRLPISVGFASNKHSIMETCRGVRAGRGTCSLHDRLGCAGRSFEYEVVILGGGEKMGPRRGQDKFARKPARRHSKNLHGTALGPRSASTSCVNRGPYRPGWS